MRELDFDALVIGGGPAGSSTALRLGREGFRVAVVEARRFPRPKPCGEFMSPECLPILRDLGVSERVRGAGAREVRGMLLHARGRRAEGRFVAVGRALAPVDHGWAIRRERFDAILLDAARASGDVEVFEGLRCAGLARGLDGEVRGVVARAPGGEDVLLRAPWTIGADGLRSAVATALGVRREVPWLRKVALTTHWAGVAWGDRAEVHFFDGGYVALAPVDGGLLSINLVTEMERYRRDALPRDAALEAALRRLPALYERLELGRRVEPVRGVGPLAGRTSRQTFDGAALVGDACGYVDPVTGEGLFFALRGAELLAADLARALRERRRDRGALARYARERRREFWPRALVARVLQRGLACPHVVRAAIGALGCRPGLADLLVSVTGDYVPYRELARPSVWLGALRSAAGARRRSA